MFNYVNTGIKRFSFQWEWKIKTTDFGAFFPISGFLGPFTKLEDILTTTTAKRNFMEKQQEVQLQWTPDI